MSVGVLIITHGEIGRALLDSAVQILGVCPLDTRCLSAPNDEDPDLVLDRALELTDGLDQGDGILVLTDLFGSTPSNISCRLQQFHNARVIAGINLPMLVRVLNYPQLHLEELTHKAISGGKDGVLVCKGRLER